MPTQPGQYSGLVPSANDFRYQPGPTPQGPPFYRGQYPPAYPWPKQQKKKSSGWLLLLPLLGLAATIALFGFLSTEGTKPKSDGTSGQESTSGPFPKPTVGSDFANENYRVPEVGEGPDEIVDTHDEPSFLFDNRLYLQPVASPIHCDAPELEDSRDKKQLENRLRALSGCLTRAFGPALEAAGYQAYRPKVLVFSSESINSPCGSLESLGAYYCPANQSIYFSDRVSLVAGRSYSAVDYVFSHEYGHNVQGRSGISAQRYYEGEKLSTAKNKELSRRMETQADCFAATFISAAGHSLSYSQEDLELVRTAVRNVGDDQFLPPSNLPGDHGISDTRERWLNTGLSAKDYSSCNTFIVPASEVR